MKRALLFFLISTSVCAVRSGGAASSVPEPWNKVEISTDEHLIVAETKNARLSRVVVSGKGCRTELSERYVNIPALVVLNGIVWTNELDEKGEYSILSINFVFVDDPEMESQAPGRVEWYFRNCSFYRRDVFRDVNGEERLIGSD